MHKLRKLLGTTVVLFIVVLAIIGGITQSDQLRDTWYAMKRHMQGHSQNPGTSSTNAQTVPSTALIGGSLSTSEDTAQTFINALRSRDIERAATCCDLRIIDWGTSFGQSKTPREFIENLAAVLGTTITYTKVKYYSDGNAKFFVARDIPGVQLDAIVLRLHEVNGQWLIFEADTGWITRTK